MEKFRNFAKNYAVPVGCLAISVILAIGKQYPLACYAAWVGYAYIGIRLVTKNNINDE